MPIGDVVLQTPSRRVDAVLASTGFGVTWQFRRLGAWAWALLACCLLIGTVVNPYRAAFFAVPVPHFRGFYPGEEQVDGVRVRWAREYAKVEYLGLDWRPVHVEIETVGRPDSLGPFPPVTLSANDRVLQRFVPGPGPKLLSVDVARRDGTGLALQFRGAAAEGQRTLGIGQVTVTPALDGASAVWHGVVGALAGLLI